MADNSTRLDAASATESIRDIDRAGIKTQVAQIDIGGASAEKLLLAGEVAKANAVPMTYATDDTASGNLTAVAQTAEIDCSQIATVTIVTSATAFVGTGLFELTNDGTTWVTAYAPTAASGFVSSVTAVSSGYQISVAGWSRFRVRCSAYTSGTMAITLRGSRVAPPGASNANISVSGTQLATSVGSVTSSLRVAHAIANVSVRIKSAASTNATSVATGTRYLHGLTLSNTSAAVLFFKLYAKASAPTVGTDTPVWTILIPAGATLIWSFVAPYSIATGLAYAITTGKADTDTAAVAVDDLTGILLYT